MLVMSNIDTLVQQLREGDDSVIHEIICFHIPLARKLAQRFVRRFPERTNDIRQAAMLGLVQAVTNASSRLYNNNIGPWINKRVVGAIRDYLDSDHMIPVPKDEWKKIKKALNLDELVDQDLIKALKKIKHRYLVYQISMQMPNGDFVEDFVTIQAILRWDINPLQLEEIKHLLQLTMYERLILRLRMQSYTLEEIAEHMDCRQATITKDLVKIQQRYIRLQSKNSNLPRPPI